MSDAPTGTVTFLFTDIEGSTALAQTHPAEWEAARVRHHAILQSTCESHRGHVFQIVGDAFCVAFGTAADALAAAVEAQERLQAETWGETPIRVRMGLHTGAAELRNGAYNGYLTLVRVQRVMSLASGGQIVVSQTTMDLTRATLPAGVRVRDLGEHRLKGVVGLERLWQADSTRLRSEFPPLRSTAAISNNLPVQLTSFIGREHDISQIEDLLIHARLVTLTGAGGTGKTRLSLEVAEQVIDQFPHGVWLVELAPLSMAQYLTEAVASVLHVLEQRDRPVFAALTEYLRDKQLLLLLDNCEHLIADCARLASALLRSAPHIKILATSRESLAIAGEAVYRVPSLETPSSEFAPTPTELTRYAAVRLFVERAGAAKAGFAVTPANAPAIARICSQLDGIPLALELAAARVKVIAPDQIAERLDDRFRLLTGGSRDAVPRQQTLQRTIDWSHDLLSDSEKVLFRRLAVFTGSWTLQATEQVCAGSIIHETEVLEQLARLVEKSLVIEEDRGREARYRMLETIRQYAAERLAAAGEGEQLRAYHLDFFRRFAEDAEPYLYGPDQATWLDRLEADRDNLRTALDYAAASGQVDTALQLAATLREFWYLQGIFNEELKQLERLLARADAATPTPARARALNAAASLLIAAVGAVERGEAYAAEALSITEALPPDALTRAESMRLIGMAAASKGDMQRAEPMLRQSVSLSRQAGQPVFLADALGNLACVCHVMGDYAQACSYFDECMLLYRSVGHQNKMAWTYRQASYAALRQGNLQQAQQLAMQSTRLNVELNSRTGIVNCLSALAGICAARRLPTIAAQMCGTVAAHLNAMHTHLYFLERYEFEKTTDLLHGTLDSAAYEAAQAEGRTLTLEQAVALCPDPAALDAAWEAGRALTLEQAVALAMENSNLAGSSHV